MNLDILLLVELVLRLVLFDVVLVALFKVLGQDDVAILPDGLHASLLANRIDIGARNAIRPRHVILQVDLIAQIHFSGDGGEDETLLTPIRKRKLDLPIETPGTQQGRVQGVVSVGGHDDLDVDRLIESVHLVQQLQENSLDLAIGAGLRVETLRRDGVDLIDEDDSGRVLLRQPEDVPDHPGPLAQILLHEL